MITEEKNERKDILKAEKRIGCVTVRYPVLDEEYMRINRYYESLAASYIRFAEKNTAKMRKRFRTGAMISNAFFCKVAYSDESLLSVKCEARIYMGNELVFSKCFSNVWNLARSMLMYKKRYGIFKDSCVAYNGKELYFFNK